MVLETGELCLVLAVAQSNDPMGPSTPHQQRQLERLSLIHNYICDRSCVRQ